ncbi:MAG: trimethylamine methyltransferase family protein [Rhodospirillales bacterium]
MADHTSRTRRSGGRSARLAARRAPPQAARPQRRGAAGASFSPLSHRDVLRIHEAALSVLWEVGMGVIGEMPPGGKLILERGGQLSDSGRIRFPKALVEQVLSGAARRWTLHGLDEARSLEIAPGRAHYGTAGGAVLVLDPESGRYREPTLADHYDMVRLVDTLPHIRWCYRSLIARDLDDVALLDINTAYALASGTTKPWGITLSSPSSVAAVTALFDLVLGGEGAFAKRPCAHMVQGAGVPPLRFAYDRCIIKEAAIAKGYPIMIASAPQAGATSPAALAGTLVQVTAEVLAGLVYVNLLRPGHPVTFAAWPFVSDLRTGAMSGGSGEQALLMAGAAQMARYYDLPCSVAAGMADSKLPDAQAGFEKATTTLLAGLAGASMVHEAAGMHASLLGCALESFVIDNDMLGSVLRTVRGIEVSEDSLSLEVIRQVNEGGAGHYLGHDQTLQLMQSEYHYPPLSDRQTPGAWEEAGGEDIVARARSQVEATLANHFPDHLSEALDAEIRGRFDIRLPRTRMRRAS